MAGTFEGLTDLEWKLFADETASRHAPYSLPPGGEYVALRPDYGLPVV